MKCSGSAVTSAPWLFINERNVSNWSYALFNWEFGVHTLLLEDTFGVLFGLDFFCFEGVDSSLASIVAPLIRFPLRCYSIVVSNCRRTGKYALQV